MQRIRIIIVGKVKDRPIQQKLDVFVKRLRLDATLEIISLRDGTPQSEGERILDTVARLKPQHLFVLTEEGAQFTSREFATHLTQCEGDLCFVIGGPEGLSAAVKQQAQYLLSLSSMTFTHEMALLFLVEQLYRAFAIQADRAYHKDAPTETQPKPQTRRQK